jgi:rfaE bifunctional protein nucleotidyltransferase chain/domain
MKENLVKSQNRKIVDPKNLPSLIEDLRQQKKSIVTLNGSFDLMHAGHLYILYEASLKGDVLIVALNSDISIKKYKSKDRPIIPLEYRVKMMSAIQAVDYVTWFDEVDPREILKIIKPDVHVNGKEYGENCIEATVVKAGGGKIYLVDRIPSLSTTEIINKIKQCV